MLRVAVSLVLLVCLVHAPLGFSKGKKWKKWKPYWCTDSGRTVIARGTSARECQNYCGDGCVAVEWWKRGKNACYLCTNLTLLTEFPHKSDMSFPPIVFVKRSSGHEFTPTKKPTTTLTTSTSDEGVAATSPQKTMTTVPSDEGTTAISRTLERTTEENAAVTESTITVVSPSAAIEEEIPSTLPDKDRSTPTLDQEGTTSVLDTEGTTTSPDDKGTASLPEREATTLSAEETGTPTSPDEEEKPTSSDEDGSPTSPDEDGTPKSPDEEGTPTLPDEDGSPTSPDEEGTTSKGERTTSTSDRKGKKWKKYKPYWCTDSGRTIIARGTSARECQNYCGDGCVAVEWWKRGKNACYLCTNLTLLAEFPHKSDMSFPPIVFVKRSSGHVLTPTALPSTKRIPATSDEGLPTTSPTEMATSKSPDVVAPTSLTDKEGTTPLPEKEVATSPGKEETTPSLDKEWTTSKPEEEVTATSPKEQGTSSSLEKEETTTTPSDKGTTSSSDEEGTTSSTDEERTTTPPYVEGATTSPSEEGTASSPDRQGTTSPPDGEGTTTSPYEEARTSSPDEEGTTTLPDEGGATTSPNDEGTMSSPDEEGTLASPEEEETTTMPYEEATTSSPDEQERTTPPDEQGTTSPADGEGRTTPPDGEDATSPADVEGTITPPTSPAEGEGPTPLPEEEGTTTSPDEQGTTSSSDGEGPMSPTDEEGTTSSPGEKGTTSPTDEERTSSPTDKEGTTSYPDEEGTTSPTDEKGTTSSPAEEGTTSPTNGEETTSSPDKEGKTSPTDGEGTTSPDEEATTSPTDGEGTTSSPDEEGKTSPTDEEGTSSSPDGEGTTSPTDKEGQILPTEGEGTTSQADEEGTSSSPDGEGTTTSPDKERTTLLPDEEATTSLPDEKGTTSLPEEQGTTPKPDEEVTATSPDEEATTTSPFEERTTSSPEEEATTTSPDEEGTTSSPEELGTTPKPDKKGTATSPDEEATTLPPDEEGTTSSPDLKVTTILPGEEGPTLSSEQESATPTPTEVTPPSSPRNVGAKALSETELEVAWEPPRETGGEILSYHVDVKVPDLTDGFFEPRSFQLPGSKLTFVVESLRPDTQYMITVAAGNLYGRGTRSAAVYSKTSKSVVARIEPTEKTNASSEEKQESCVNIYSDDGIYTLNASHGKWPHDGLCHAPIASNASKHDSYRLSADLYVPEAEESDDDIYLGVFFNAADAVNFDFVLFRFGVSGETCFQSGVMQQGQVDWFGSQTGSCPYGAPRKGRWIYTTLEVRDSDVTVFLDGVHVTSVKGHLTPKASGGTVLAKNQGNVAQFKDFTITDLPSLPFETRSCASLQENNDYYSLINHNDVWSHGFCRALLKETPKEDSSSYQISVDLFSEVDWSGDRVAYLGIIFNARDINNGDFIYFRPFWKDHCYQTGYLLMGRQMREGSKTGHCSCAVKSGKWFNVRLEIRGYKVNVIMNNKPAATFKAHYHANVRGSGILVTGGCQKAIRFRNFVVAPLPELPFVSKNCQSARVTGKVYKIMAYSGEGDDTDQEICRAMYPKIIEGSSYVISVDIYTQGSVLGGKYGVLFNAKNPNTFEFVYFRPYNRDSCVQAGHFQGNKVKTYPKLKALSCGYGFLRSGNWYNIRVKVTGSTVKVLINDIEVAVFKSLFEAAGRGGIMLGSGVKRKISFKDYRILIK